LPIEVQPGSLDFVRFGALFGFVLQRKPYVDQWTRRECIANRHDMVLSKPFGVVLHCRDCNATQGFNWIP
jgi:hypothetical protein